MATIALLVLSVFYLNIYLEKIQELIVGSQVILVHSSVIASLMKGVVSFFFLLILLTKVMTLIMRKFHKKLVRELPLLTGVDIKVSHTLTLVGSSILLLIMLCINMNYIYIDEYGIGEKSVLSADSYIKWEAVQRVEMNSSFVGTNNDYRFIYGIVTESKVYNIDVTNSFTTDIKEKLLIVNNITRSKHVTTLRDEITDSEWVIIDSLKPELKHFIIQMYDI